jgi:hypothetical protein
MCNGQTTLYPDGDLITANWNVQGEALHYLAIDEPAPHVPTDIIWSSTSGAWYECSLSDSPDPNSSATHTINVVLWSDLAPATFQIRLSQGSTIIANWVQSHTGTYTAYSYDLTTAQADAITNYNDLKLRIRHNVNAFNAVSMMNLTIPTASGPSPSVNKAMARHLPGSTQIIREGYP